MMRMEEARRGLVDERAFTFRPTKSGWERWVSGSAGGPGIAIHGED